MFFNFFRQSVLIAFVCVVLFKESSTHPIRFASQLKSAIAVLQTINSTINSRLHEVHRFTNGHFEQDKNYAALIGLQFDRHKNAGLITLLALTEFVDEFVSGFSSLPGAREPGSISEAVVKVVLEHAVVSNSESDSDSNNTGLDCDSLFETRQLQIDFHQRFSHERVAFA